MENLEKNSTELVLPSAKYKDSFIEALEEYELVDKEDPAIREARKKDFDFFLEDTEKNSKGLIVEAIPQIQYWCVEGDKYIGNINYRPKLNEKLQNRGGNIGYTVRPSERGKGYATFMLNEVLNIARKDGLSEVLLTCDDDNHGSIKVIKKAGGIREDGDIDKGKNFSRYIINL